MIEGSILWTPKSKERPRFRGNHAYTPKATRDAEAAIVRELYRQGLIPNTPITDPLAIEIFFGGEAFYFRMWPVTEPAEKGMHRDIDNMSKLVLDAFNGVLYEDDTQIVDSRLVKM